MAATGVRIPRALTLTITIAAVTSWALRDNAEFLPSGRMAPNLVANPAHGHAVDGYEPPPAITGDALANYTGLAVFALHALMIAVVITACCVRRWRRSSTVDTQGVVVRVMFSASVAVASALVAAGMAAMLLGTAISLAATLTAAVTVLQYSFVLALAFSAVFGVP